MDKHYRNEHWPERQPEGRTQPADIGEETEADALDRATLEWDAQGDRVFDFLFDSPELSLPIAMAAITYMNHANTTYLLELSRVIDTAKQAFIQWRLR